MAIESIIYIVGLVVCVIAMFAWVDGADKGKW